MASNPTPEDIQNRINQLQVSAADLSRFETPPLTETEEENLLQSPFGVPFSESDTSRATTPVPADIPYAAPSGSDPLMTTRRMHETIAATLDVGHTEGYDLYNGAKGIVEEWSSKAKRSITTQEKDALTHAVMDGNVTSPDLFDGILLGYRLRGEHNVIECRNVYNAMQEMLNNTISSQKDFLKKANTILEGVTKVAAKSLAGGPPLPDVIPVKSPVMPTPVIPSILPPPTPAISAQQVNQKIEKLKVNEEGNVDDPAVFCKILGRQIPFIKRIIGDVDPNEAIMTFLRANPMTPEKMMQTKSDVWRKFTDMVEAIKSPKK